jgi:hypothetical protein
MAFALNACAPPPYRARVASLSAACSSDWSQLKLDRPALESPKITSVEFADHSACLGPPAVPARTSVLLYELDEVPRPAQIRVELVLSGGGTLAGAVDVFDASFHLLKHHGFKDFTRRGDAFTLPVFLRDGGPRYLAVSPDMMFVGTEMKTVASRSTVTPVSTGYGTFTVVNGSEFVQTVPFMAGGKISVTIEADSRSGQAAAP